MGLGPKLATSTDANHRENLAGTSSLFADDYMAELESTILARARRRLASKSASNHCFVSNTRNLKVMYSLEVFLDRLRLDFGNVVQLAPRERYNVLNSMMTHYIRAMPIRGIASLNLLILARALQKSGHVYVGDVIQLRPEELELHAVAVNRVKDPARLAAHFKRLLAASDLHLGMKAPGWARPQVASFEHQLRERDARNERETRQQALQPHGHLRLVQD